MSHRYTIVPLPQTAGVIGNGTGTTKKMLSDTGKGYDISLGTLNATTKKLQASVTGQTWTDIVNPLADGQGAIADQYHYVRIVVAGYTSGGSDTKVYVTV